MAVEFLNTNTAIVNSMYCNCSSSQSLLVVRRRPHVVMGGGFVVTSSCQKILFRVDGCGVTGRIGEVMLRDGHGHPLLVLQKMEGLVQVLHVHRQWRGFASDHQAAPNRLAFILKDSHKSCFSINDAIRIWTQPSLNNGKQDWDFEIRGNFPDKDCSIVDHQGTVVAQIATRKELMTTNQDLYHVVISPGVDQAFVVGVIAVLDSIYGESTVC